MARVVLLVLSFAITIYAMADCVRTPSEELPARLPKALWLLVILLFTPIGGIAWIIITRVTQAEARGGQFNRGIWYSETPAVKFPSRHRTEAPIDAPDNDPEFLWKLEKELQRKRQQEADNTGDTSVSGGSTTGPDSAEPTSTSGIDSTEPGDGTDGESSGRDSGTDNGTDNTADASKIDKLGPFAADEPGKDLGGKPNDDPVEDLRGEPNDEPGDKPDGERPTTSPQSP